MRASSSAASAARRRRFRAAAVAREYGELAAEETIGSKLTAARLAPRYRQGGFDARAARRPGRRDRAPFEGSKSSPPGGTLSVLPHEAESAARSSPLAEHGLVLAAAVVVVPRAVDASSRLAPRHAFLVAAPAEPSSASPAALRGGNEIWVNRKLGVAIIWATVQVYAPPLPSPPRARRPHG